MSSVLSSETRPDAGGGSDAPVRIIILSSSLLTDRMFLYTGFLRALADGADARIWAMSLAEPRNRDWWRSSPCPVEEFPQVGAFRERLNYIRRMNERAWDLRLQPPSRLSMARHESEKILPGVRAAGRLIRTLRAERSMEHWLERIMLSQDRSPAAMERLRQFNPDAVLTTGPFQFEQPAVVAAARLLSIPVLAMIPSWDNISTKKRMVFRYDGFVVWSERTRQELAEFYPDSRDVPVYVVGAPQFDVFFQGRFHETREVYCRRYGLDPGRKIILYAVGSPNFLKGEQDGALDMARRVDRGDFGDAQLIVRPHPIHDKAELVRQFGSFSGRVVLQRTSDAGVPLSARTQNEDQITDWVNTFRHADVVVNLSSTVTVDAALFDRPVVNINYDPSPSGGDDRLIKEINTIWTHFGPVAQSGGVWLTQSPDETSAAVRAYLDDPSIHRAGRQWIVNHVCGHADGKCGVRLAEAVLDFAVRSRRKRR